MFGVQCLVFGNLVFVVWLVQVGSQLGFQVEKQQVFPKRIPVAVV